MLDIKLFREKPEIVRESQKRRGEDPKLVDDVIAWDNRWRKALQDIEKLKHEKNTVSEEINQLKKQGKSADEKIKQMKEVANKVKELEEEAERTKNNRDQLLLNIPNILDKRVPIGDSDQDNKEIKKWGKIPKFKFKPKDHIDLGLALDLFDVEKAAILAGARFYFLKNEAVILNQALAQYALHLLKEEGYTPIMPPNLVRYEVLKGAGYFPGSEEDTYKIEGEDLYLIGTSEQVLCALHKDETLAEKDLPKWYAGYSPCYRTEAGAHGRDTKGIFRIHQFEKVEQVKLCLPENSESEHKHLLKMAEKVFQGLGIPYHVIINCTGDIGYNACAMKYDIEAWLPGQNKYREVVSCSNCTDYQARRLNTKVKRKDGTVQIVHTLNSTAVAIERALIAILENFQQKDGSVKIPKVLWKYTGFKEIKPKKR